MAVRIGTIEFSQLVDYLKSHRVLGALGGLYISEEGLREKGHPIPELRKLNILGNTALIYKSDGTKTLFYRVNYNAVEKHLSRMEW